MTDKTRRLFKDGTLFDDSLEAELDKQNQPVTCLGKTFPNEEERRKYYLEKLREKLKDPEFRKIEGFPIGSDEDILALSDPPYYTACPNPFIQDFIKCFSRPYQSEKDNYHREPFAADVSEGKNDPIYLAHTYHTKVPYKAIMRFILHYTKPGDVVFDGFCGTGMVGVAVKLCGSPDVVRSLGYNVDDKGSVYIPGSKSTGKSNLPPFSKIGTREAILADLSPAATFIAYHFTTPANPRDYTYLAKKSLAEVENELSWLYRTQHPDTGQSGRINYVVWSDVFLCPECAYQIIFWDVAVDQNSYQVKEYFRCPNCSVTLKKRQMQRAFESRLDPHIGQVVKHAKQVPVLIHYHIGRHALLKRPDEFDLHLLRRISEKFLEIRYPTSPLPKGDKTSDPFSVGITHVHHFYTERSLICLSAFAEAMLPTRNFINVTSIATVASKMYRFRSQGGSLGAGGGPMNGTLYVPSLSKEIPVTKLLKEHIEKTSRVKQMLYSQVPIFTSTSSHTDVRYIPESSVDYIFTDPPFGANLMYSELNSIWESWLQVKTNNQVEAIVNRSQKKGLVDYQELMTKAFEECYRILKPGRWLTVEFHNSKNSVWTAIQESIQQTGFVIGDVRTLDKKQGSFNAVNAAGAVKKDLIITAYKPTSGLEERFKLEAGSPEGLWDFIRTHLAQLPVFLSKGVQVEIIVERQHYLLYDRMVAFHVQRSVTVPLSAAEFYKGLAQRFPERDGMYFLSEQAAEYDKKRMTVREILQLELFVTDESSAIQWLRQQLIQKPQTFQELHPQFLKEIGGWLKHEKPLELSLLLEQNFIRYDGKDEVASQIHSYLSTNFKELRKLPKDDPVLRAKAKDRWYVPDPNKGGDLEKVRERSLLKEFWEYLPAGYERAREAVIQSTLPGMEVEKPQLPRGKRLKVIRLEAVRVGFKHCWQERDYRAIMAVAQRIPKNVLQEDPKLLMWYDQAVTRSGESA